MLETQDLILRHTNKQDDDDFISLVTLPAFGKLSPFGAMSAEKAQNTLDQIIANYDNDEKYEFWTVLDKKKNEYAGFVGYQPVQFEGALEEMFFIGFNRRFWGSSLPLHAAQAASQFAFKQDLISELIAFIHPEDVESLFIAQSLGSDFKKQCLIFDTTLLLFSITPQQSS